MATAADFDMSDPDEVTIIVHNAKDLKGKKAGRHKFSVIFGLGITKFRTVVVKDTEGNPMWNEETVVPVSNILDQVYFIVTEKDDILGQVTVPVGTLKDTKGFVKREALQPHKKCPKPQGELTYQCYISKHRAPGDRIPVLSHMVNTPDEVRPQSAFQRLRKRMASPVTQRKSKNLEKDIKDNKDKDRRGNSISSFNKKLSRSIQDLFSFGKLSAHHDTIDLDEENSESYKNNVNKMKNKRKFSLNFLSVSNDLDTVGKDPEIKKCMPNRGPIDQPTRLCIDGSNLGIGKSDILSLKVAGCDCTDTVEFESSNRIYCTTHFWKVCSGPVEIDTISGGIGTLKNGFTFYEELDANGNASTNPFDVEEDDEVAEPPENINFVIGGKQIKSGSNTLPRIKASKVITDNPPPSPSTPTGRYKKNHARTSSESVVNVTSKPPTPPVGRVDHISKEELMAKINKLEVENAELRKDNVGMKGYIDKLVAKCMLHCPEALAQDDDEKTKLFVL